MSFLTSDPKPAEGSRVNTTQSGSETLHRSRLQEGMSAHIRFKFNEEAQVDVTLAL